jgi:hypothetical protein
MTTPRDSPYKFLDSYALGDRSRFFGRAPETNILVADIVTARLVVLFAKTGTGKTSLINAGARPVLHDRGYETFYVRVEEDPIASARKTIGAKHPTIRESGTFTDQLVGLAQKIKCPIVLFFDQFEEFFLYVVNDKPRLAKQFVDAIGDVYDDKGSGVHVVFSMREEFFVELELFRDRIPAIYHADSNLRLKRLQLAQARTAIIEPARMAGVKIDSEVGEEIIRDLTGGGGGDELIEPAQLQIICDALWSSVVNDRIELADYRKLGRSVKHGNVAHAILYQRIRREMEAIEDKEELELAERLLPLLRTDRHTKWIRDLSSLVQVLRAGGQGVDEDQLRRLLHRLARVGLINMALRDRMDTVELTHDYIVEHLDAIVTQIRAIWPQRMLEQALARHSVSGDLATREELNDIVAGLLDLDLGQRAGEAGQLMFLSAVSLSQHEVRMFDFAEQQGSEPIELLMLWLESATPSDRARAMTLLVELIGKRPRVRARGFGALQEMLDDPGKTTEAQRALGDLASTTRLEAPDVGETATTILLDFLREQLPKGRVDPNAVRQLGLIQRPEAVDVLAEALSYASVRTHAEKTLEQLAESESDVAPAARRALTQAPAIHPREAPAASAPILTTPATSRDHATDWATSEIEVIADAVRQMRCILFLGAGAHAPPPVQSRFEYPAEQRPLIGAELSRKLAADLSFSGRFPNEDPSNLQRVALFYEAARSRRQLVDAVKDAVQTGKRPSPMLRALAELSFPLVITTNYDQLFEQALKEAGKEPRVTTYTPHLEPTVDFRDPTAESPVVFKIHGDILRPETVVLTDEDYIQFVLRMSSKEPYDPVPLSLKYYMTSWTTLFVGYSLLDYNLRMLFKTLRWKIDSAIMPDMYCVDYRPDPLLFDVWHNQRRYVQFIAQDLWAFIPGLHERVLGEQSRPYAP